MRRRHALATLLILLLAVTAAASQVTTYPVGQGSTYQTDSGLSVSFGTDADVQSGNPFDDATTFRYRNTTFSAPGDAAVTVDALNPIRTAGIQTSGKWLSINNTDTATREIRVRGDIDRFYIERLNLSRSADQTDVTIDSTSQPAVRFNTSLTEDETVLAVDRSTDTVVSSTQVAANGTATFENIDSGTYDVDFRRGPSVLRVFNESSPSQLISGNTTLTIRFFPGDQEEVVERTTTDGTVALPGDLPRDEEIVVTVDDEATNYTYRRVILESLYQQQSVYLLPNSVANIGVTFELNDKTGQFGPQQSRLFVEKPIRKDFDGDGDNETRYQTIVGDNFGAGGSFPAVIEPNQRYRLRVENRDGDSRVLGAYSAAQAGAIDVPIGEIQIEGRGAAGASFGASLVETNDSQFIRVQYRDAANDTSELDLEIVSENGTVIRPNTTEFGPFGTYTETFDVPDQPEDATYEVRFHAQRDSSEDIGGVRYVGAVAGFDFPVDEGVLRLLGWVVLVGLSGGLVLVDDRLAALGTVVVGSGLTVVGILSIPTIALGIAGAIALLYNIGRFRP